MNEFLKEQYYTQPSKHIFGFKNIYHFMDFCYLNKLTQTNSITYYDEENATMYIKHI